MNYLDIRIEKDGTVVGIYQDGIEDLADALGTMSVARLSNVEHEGIGWTVRAAHDFSIAIREDGSVSKEGRIAYFKRREDALLAEKQKVWELMP